MRFFYRSIVVFAALVVIIIAAIGAAFVVAPNRVKHMISTALIQNGQVSVELTGANGTGSPKDRVSTWLRQYHKVILVTAATYRVDPRAIAGAIAYESLANAEPSYYLGLADYAGPGKVHFKEDRFSEGNPVAKEVEDRGYLPRESESDREFVLSTPAGALTYIAAIMDGFANVAHAAGNDVRCRPAMLVTLYSAWNLRALQTHFAQTKHHVLQLNDAGTWYRENAEWVAAGLGPASCPWRSTGIFMPRRLPRLAQPVIHVQH